MILRLLELCLTCVLLIIFSPLLLVIALAILVDGGWPVFYLSPRVGKDGEHFNLFYFRTMQAGSAPSSERLTRVGRFLRHNSLDHVPQLFNLLRGDMHIIGPVPLRPEQIDLDNPQYQAILKVKPGMLSPSLIQLGKYFNASKFTQKVELEQAYLAERTLRKDVRFFGEAFSAFARNKRNVKMHGEPTVDVELEASDEA